MGMTRPREPLADALRTARDIVQDEGSALAFAARGADETAIEEAGARLAHRIAEAIVEAERHAAQQAADLLADGHGVGIDDYVRAITRS